MEKQSILKVFDEAVETMYTIFYDDCPVEVGTSFDFGDQEANQEYLNRFVNEELFSFGVVKSTACKCCNGWKEEDSLWGIHAQDAHEALEYYQNQ
jgi:hypothetical protein